ncbi:24868_t:CDS:1, partial [Dentiscutata erythropus]
MPTYNNSTIIKNDPELAKKVDVLENKIQDLQTEIKNLKKTKAKVILSGIAIAL